MPRVSRREFVGTMAAGALVIPAWPQIVTAGAPSTAHWSIVIPPKGEPGPAIEVAGRVFAADGMTPLPGMRLSVYHTDVEGYYSRPVSNPRQARLRGTMVTDAQGRYAFRTILPGHYPGGGNPRHIHVHLAGADVPEHWIESYLFDGDPELERSGRRTARDDSFSHVLKLQRQSDGVLHGTRDIRLDDELARRNRLVDGWYRNGEDDGV